MNKLFPSNYSLLLWGLAWQAPRSKPDIDAYLEEKQKRAAKHEAKVEARLGPCTVGKQSMLFLSFGLRLLSESSFQRQHTIGRNKPQKGLRCNPLAKNL